METQTQARRQKTSKSHKALSVVGIVLCVILLPIIIVNCTLLIKRWVNKDEVPTFGGVFPMIVLTDSMKGEFDAGDMIICKKIDANDVKVGDIICFYDVLSKSGTTVTHRVTEVITDSDGNILWRTKGDNNNTEDVASVPAKNLVGKYVFHVKGMGDFALFMQSTAGLIIFIAVPIALLVAYDVIRRRLYERKNTEDTDALKAELAALRADKALADGSLQADGSPQADGAEKADSAAKSGDAIKSDENDGNEGNE